MWKLTCETDISVWLCGRLQPDFFTQPYMQDAAQLDQNAALACLEILDAEDDDLLMVDEATALKALHPLLASAQSAVANDLEANDGGHMVQSCEPYSS